MKKNNKIQYTLALDGYSIEQLLGIYVDSLSAENRSPKTISRYVYTLRDFNYFLLSNNLPLTVNQITKKVIITYVNHLKSVKKWSSRINCCKEYGSLSPYTIEGHIRDLKAFWSWLSKEKYIDCNIMAGFPLPKVPQYIMKIPSKEQLKKILSAIDKNSPAGCKYYCIMLLLFDTGMRISELVSIQLTDVDMLRGTIKILGKGQKEREVPFSSVVRKELGYYIKNTRPHLCQNSNQYLFPNSYDHITVCSVQQYMRRLSQIPELNDIKLHPHLFRHACATNMIANGANVYVVKDILGHASLQTTLKYTHLQADDIKREHNKYSPVSALMK